MDVKVTLRDITQDSLTAFAKYPNWLEINPSFLIAVEISKPPLIPFYGYLDMLPYFPNTYDIRSAPTVLKLPGTKGKIGKL